MMMSVFVIEENIEGEGENAGLPAISPFPPMFSKPFIISIVKTQYFVSESHLYQLYNNWVRGVCRSKIR